MTITARCVEVLLEEIHKKFDWLGKLDVEKREICILSGNDIANTQELTRINTGILALDVTLGGGLPKASIIEFWGPESVGKTSIALKCASSAMKQLSDACVGYVCMESPVSEDWARKLGVPLDDRLNVVYPNKAEDALEVAFRMITSRKFSLVILDSVPALTAETEAKSQIGKRYIAPVALLNTFLRKVINTLGKGTDPNQTSVILINQVRVQFGLGWDYSPDELEYTPGGRGLRHFKNLSIKFIRQDLIRSEEDEVVGMAVRFIITKSKISNCLEHSDGNFDFYIKDNPPFKAGEIDYIKDVRQEACKANVITRSGAYYEYAGRSFHGQASLDKYLMEQPDIREEIHKKVVEFWSNKRKVDSVE